MRHEKNNEEDCEDGKQLLIKLNDFKVVQLNYAMLSVTVSLSVL